MKTKIIILILAAAATYWFFFMRKTDDVACTSCGGAETTNGTEPETPVEAEHQEAKRFGFVYDGYTGKWKETASRHVIDDDLTAF